MNAGDRVAVQLHGRTVEVPRATLDAELAREGPLGSLALVEAIVAVGKAPGGREAAVARLARGVAGGGTAAGPVTLTSILALVRLQAAEAAPTLRAAAERLPSPLGETARAAHHLVLGEATALARRITTDDLLAQRTPVVLCALPCPRAVPGLDALVRALLESLTRLQPGLGVTAYRAFLGDLAEALFRALQRGARLEPLLGAQREALVDRLCAELPGTPDLVAARAMAWLLGALTPGDDAARSAVERARARFRDEGFHADCARILGEAPGGWP